MSEEERTKRVDAVKSGDENKDDETPLLSDAEIKELEKDPHEAPKSDPQLETALLLVRVKLAACMPWPREFVAAARAE